MRDGGQRYRDVAEAISSAASSLRSLEGGESQADSVNALLESRDEIVTAIEGAQGRYQTAGDALVTYAGVLDTVQSDTASALASARTAKSDESSAEYWADRYDEMADDARRAEDSESEARYLRLARENRADASAARSVVATQQNVIRDAVADRDAAAQSAIGQIEEITSADGLRDSWWDNWGSKVVGWIAKVAEFVASVAGILALVLCWVPVLGQALLAIAAIAGIIAAIANIALAATGEKSWLEAGLRVVFAALGCLGLGGLKGMIGAIKAGANFVRTGGIAAMGGFRALLAGSASNIASGVRNIFARFRPPGAATNLADDVAEVAVAAADDLPTVTFSRERAPEICANIDDAVANGAPTELTRTDSVTRDANRRAALRGREPAQTGFSLDEYPFASTVEGGAGSTVRAVPVAEQNYQGGVLSSFYQHKGVNVGDRFRVRIVP